MWKLLTCRGDIHVWDLLTYGGDLLTCGTYSHVKGTFTCEELPHMNYHVHELYMTHMWRELFCGRDIQM